MNLIQLFFIQIIATIIGMAFFNFRRGPQEPPIPPFAFGGFALFSKVLGSTYICSILFGYAFSLVNFNQGSASDLAYLVLPSICAFYITKLLLSRK